VNFYRNQADGDHFNNTCRLDKSAANGDYCIEQYCFHYHHRRPHQGIGDNMIEPLPQVKDDKIVLEHHLVGLLKSYRRVA
jgi:hypothetical protein